MAVALDSTKMALMSALANAPIVPDLPVLLITGYLNSADSMPDDLPRLAKPFRQADLAAHVARLIESEENQPRPAMA